MLVELLRSRIGMQPISSSVRFGRGSPVFQKVAVCSLLCSMCTLRTLASEGARLQMC